MKKLLLIAGFIVTWFHSTAQQSRDQHLLDGTSVEVYYKSGSHEHTEFSNGQIISKWISGPGQNATGTESYNSIKIADKMYVVNFLKTPDHSFVTLIINFNQNKLHASAIRGVGTNNEAIFLEEATIVILNLKEQ